MRQTGKYENHTGHLKDRNLRYNRRRRKRKLQVTLYILLILFLIGGVVWRTYRSELKLLESKAVSTSESPRQTQVNSEDWKLILVNRTNPVPDNYQVRLTELSNGKKVDSRIYPELQQMFDDARTAGLALFVREGYRTKEEQQQILDERIQEYENQGDSKKDAQKAAEEYVALPGTSEHQLGMSVDINADTQKCSSDAVYQWLDENAYKYGFIKRYPADKTDITGISNEPWHYRYVGKEAAKTMKEQNLCLEEYLQS